jgi:ABC-2 type transport system ATP-binding protein
VPDAILSARGFTYRYPEAAGPALTDVNLDVEPGSFVVVAGESGSGKSTLLRAACGLVPHFHGGDVAGELEVGGMDVRTHGPGDLAAICGTVFQDPESQVVMSGVRAEVSLPLEHRGVSAGAVARAVEELALVLGIAGLLDRQVETLSGGELQRVALAAALAHRPRLLVLDEPTVGLDPEQRLRFREMISHAGEGRTVVMSSHQTEDITALCTRIAVIHQGRPRFTGTPAELTARAEGRVWADGQRSPAALAAWRTGEGAYRNVGDPPAGAELIAPTLEDAYLLLMGGSELEVTR